VLKESGGDTDGLFVDHNIGYWLLVIGYDCSPIEISERYCFFWGLVGCLDDVEDLLQIISSYCFCYFVLGVSFCRFLRGKSLMIFDMGVSPVVQEEFYDFLVGVVGGVENGRLSKPVLFIDVWWFKEVGCVGEEKLKAFYFSYAASPHCRVVECIPLVVVNCGGVCPCF
jgi:hypothetical protein